jgi:Ribbon-helix-helix protein, copG family
MRSRIVEIDSKTADLLEREARARGLTLAEFLRCLAAEEFVPLRHDVKEMREHGRGPWSPQALAEDGRAMAAFEETGKGYALDEITAWMESWGTADELPMPGPHKF